MKEPLTPKQQKMYAFIRAHIVKEQRPPSIRELMTHFRLASPNAVVCLLERIERRGWIKRKGFRACGMKLVGVSVRLEDTGDET